METELWFALRNALTVFRATSAAYARKETVGSLSDSNRMERVPNGCNESQRPEIDGPLQSIGRR
jgi:hypothetical protein